MRLCAVLGLTLCAYGQTTAPPASEQATLVARMRDAALHYASQLEDFLCTQDMTRSVDSSGSGKRWKPLETQKLELGYIAHKEHYRLLEVDGKTTDLEKRVKKGYFRPGGEFGTSLLWVFDPKAAAEFEWDHEELSAERRSCVFRYRIPIATSIYVMRADEDRVRMALRGFVTADCSTGVVTRLQIETEPASVKRRGQDLALGMHLDVYYAPATVASKAFLLPEHAVESRILEKL